MEHELNYEAVEWGVRRETPYIRQRRAYKEMEETENGEQRSISNTAKRNHQM